MTSKVSPDTEMSLGVQDCLAGSCCKYSPECLGDLNKSPEVRPPAPDPCSVWYKLFRKGSAAVPITFSPACSLCQGSGFQPALGPGREGEWYLIGGSCQRRASPRPRGADAIITGLALSPHPRGHSDCLHCTCLLPLPPLYALGWPVNQDPQPCV